MDKFVNFNSSPATNNSFMSTIQSAGSKMNTTTIIIIVVVILFISIACACYYFYIVPSSNAMYRANNELRSQCDNKEAELLFFYADWCPHCKTAKPVWESLKAQYENKTINGYKVIFTEINCTTENAEVEKMMDKYNVEGFPTIKMLKDGQIIEYDAKPTKETLDQFLNTVLN
jgi:thiol-disulfide isomerase/thioredoxin